MKLSVIVPTCNRPRHLALCLERFADGAQSLPFADYEIIVTDDSSNQATEQWVKAHFPWVRWIQGPRRGPAANRNKGANQATGPWLVFCDDDCLPDPGFLDAFASLIAKEPDVRVIEGRTYADRAKGRLDEVSPINESGGYLWSCNFAILRSLFLMMGGFDERFPFAAMEDVEFHDRLKSRGYSARFLPNASVCHPWRRTGGWQSIRKSVESHRIYWSIHPDKHRTHTVGHFAVSALRVIRRVAAELVEFRGRGWLGGLQEIGLCCCLALESLRHPAEYRR